jgi:hypothetical protein
MIKYLSHPLLLSCIALLSFTLPLFSGHQTLPTSTPSWHTVPVPLPTGTTFSWLSSITASSPHDAWAVGGYQRDHDGQHQYALIEHWNGARWEVVPAPTLAQPVSNLLSVTASSSHDAWAVGMTATGAIDGVIHPLALHWNGRAWRELTLPAEVMQGTGQLQSVSVDPVTRTVYAVGTVARVTDVNGTMAHTGVLLTLTKGAQEEQLPAIASNTHLLSVSASSDGEAWAAGIRDDTAGLLLHQGKTGRWQVRTPYLAHDYQITAILALSKRSVWTVGVNQRTDELHGEHWNGLVWTEVPLPRVGSLHDRPLALAGISDREVWMVGEAVNPRASIPLIERWNGEQWSVVTIAPPAFANSSLSGVSVIPGSHAVWIVGHSGDAPLVECYS